MKGGRTQQEDIQIEGISSYIYSTTCGGKENQMPKSPYQIEIFNSSTSSDASQATLFYVTVPIPNPHLTQACKDSSKTKLA